MGAGLYAVEVIDLGSESIVQVKARSADDARRKVAELGHTPGAARLVSVDDTPIRDTIKKAADYAESDDFARHAKIAKEKVNEVATAVAILLWGFLGLVALSILIMYLVNKN